MVATLYNCLVGTVGEGRQKEGRGLEKWLREGHMPTIGDGKFKQGLGIPVFLLIVGTFSSHI